MQLTIYLSYTMIIIVFIFVVVHENTTAQLQDAT